MPARPGGDAGKQHLGQVFGPRLPPEDLHLLDPPKPRPPTGQDAWGRPQKTQRDYDLEDADLLEHRCFLSYFQRVELETRLFANLRAEAEAEDDLFRAQRCAEHLNEVRAEVEANERKLERLAKDVASGKQPGGVYALLEFWASLGVIEQAGPGSGSGEGGDGPASRAARAASAASAGGD